jgi:hypothetical protein
MPFRRLMHNVVRWDGKGSVRALCIKICTVVDIDVDVTWKQIHVAYLLHLSLSQRGLSAAEGGPFLPCTCVRQGTVVCKVQVRLERCGDT